MHPIWSASGGLWIASGTLKTRPLGLRQFGLLSLVGGDRSRANVVAIEDTIAFMIPREKMLVVLQENPAVNEYFLKSFVINFIDKSHDETRQRTVGIGGGDQLLFTTRVGELVRREPVSPGRILIFNLLELATSGIRLIMLTILQRQRIGHDSVFQARYSTWAIFISPGSIFI